MGIESTRKKSLNKFGAIRTKVDDIGFDSKMEAKYYNKLKMAQSAGELLYFLRQPLFDLGGGVTYKADFLEVWSDGEIKIVDVKGVETAGFKVKKKIVESRYPIKINVIKKV